MFSIKLVVGLIIKEKKSSGIIYQNSLKVSPSPYGINVQSTKGFIRNNIRTVSGHYHFSIKNLKKPYRLSVENIMPVCNNVDNICIEKKMKKIL